MTRGEYISPRSLPVRQFLIIIHILDLFPFAARVTSRLVSINILLYYIYDNFNVNILSVQLTEVAEVVVFRRQELADHLCRVLHKRGLWRHGQDGHQTLVDDRYQTRQEQAEIKSSYIGNSTLLWFLGYW